MRKTIETAVAALSSRKRLRLAVGTAAASAGLVAVPFVATAAHGAASETAAVAELPARQPVSAQHAVQGKAVALKAAQDRAFAEKVAQAAKAKAAAQQKAAKAKAAKVKAAKQQAAKQKAAKLKASRAHARKALHQGNASWVVPVDHYTLSAGFAQSGARWAHKHSGQDFAVPTGTPVKTVHSGTVVEAGWGGAYGNNIVVRHADGRYSQYGHLSRIGVSVGQHVATDQVLGRSGSTGNSTGPHLHFEIRTTPFYGSALEPLRFLRSHGVRV